MPQLTRQQRIVFAENRGADAYARGLPLLANPYRNTAGGRLYYRAYRDGWKRAQQAESNNDAAEALAASLKDGGR